ncbi:MAG: 2-dehydro-3-deoxygalactonokinase [Pseudomonadota bacterium]
MSASGTYAEWIAVEGAQGRLRAWAMVGHRPIAEAKVDNDPNSMDSAGFEGAVLALVDPWLGGGLTPILVAGAPHAPTRTVPCTPLPDAAPGRSRFTLIPGLRQSNPPDIMRGDEARIAGFLAGSPDFDGVLCLPGAHSRWAQISAGEVVSFRTFMTGALFDLLSKSTVLSPFLGEGWDESAFAEAVSDGVAKPELIAARLFGIHAEASLTGLDEGAAAARLWGLLIGIELAAARPYWLGQNLALIADEVLSSRYAAALSLQGLDPVRSEEGPMLRRGLDSFRRALLEVSG